MSGFLGFVQNWFAPRANPIGVDFGSDCLRLAQVQWTGTEFRVIAAASCDVPHHVRHNAATRLQFFAETTRDLLAQGNFHGRQAVLGLPAAAMFIQHLRMNKLDEEETRKALPWEARGKLPIDPSQALIRHLIAGEVYQDQDPKNEVIVMAAAREFIHQLLAAASRAKLDVVGMNIEPKALVDCFAQAYRRKTDLDATNCFVDIGCTASRAIIARGQHIYFARAIPVGGDHFTRAVGQAMSLGFEEAKMFRIKQCSEVPALDEQREKQAIRTDPGSQPEGASFSLLEAAVRAQSNGEPAGSSMQQAPTPASSDTGSDTQNADQARRVDEACREPLSKLVEELDLCRRYYEATFPNKPVDRLIFVGGEARQRSLCQQIARELGIAAQVGDPLFRMGRVSDIGVESGIDRRLPQPSWAIALGLSLGNVVPTGKGNSSAATSRSEVRA